MKLLLLFLGVSIISGCSSTGYGTANHNGLMYYFPENCERYNYSYDNPSVLKCLHDGQLTGQVLYPASQEQIANYRYQQESIRQAFKEASQTIQDSTPKTTRTNCRELYGNVKCTSTTY